MLRQLRFAGGKTKAPRGTDLHRVLPRSWAGAQVSTRSVGFGGPSCSLSVVCGGRSASAFVQPRPWAPGCSPAWIGRVSPWPSERSWRGRASVATGPRPLGGFLEAGSIRTKGPSAKCPQLGHAGDAVRDTPAEGRALNPLGCRACTSTPALRKGGKSGAGADTHRPAQHHDPHCLGFCPLLRDLLLPARCLPRGLTPKSGPGAEGPSADSAQGQERHGYSPLAQHPKHTKYRPHVTSDFRKTTARSWKEVRRRVL